MSGPNECPPPGQITTAVPPAADLSHSKPCHLNNTQYPSSTTTLESNTVDIPSDSSVTSTSAASPAAPSYNGTETTSESVSSVSLETESPSGMSDTSSPAGSPSIVASSTINAEPSLLSDHPTEASDAATSSVTPSAVDALAKSTKNTGTIAGGVIGGVAFLVLLILGTILFLRRRRRKRTPASAEFRDRHSTGTGTNPWPLAAQGSDEGFHDHDIDEGRATPPPAFSPRGFNHPLYEKLEDGKNAQPTYGVAV